MKHVALATYKDSPNFTKSDALLALSLEKIGITAHATPWDDTRINWSNFDSIVLRSCWNYYIYQQNFLLWIDQIKRLHIPLFNHQHTIHWNMHKSYMFDLKNRNIPIIPSMLLQQYESISLESIARIHAWDSLVIKPCVGAAAHNITLIHQHEYVKMQPKVQKLLQETDCLVQPFMKEIISDGEYSFIFIDNSYSHTVIKRPKQGEFRSNDRFGGTIATIEPHDGLIKQATHVLKSLKTDTLYARVDGVDKNGIFTLMELELIEPNLFFDTYPSSSEVFARALKKKL